MKKLLAFIITAAMLMSVISAFALTASAADESVWDGKFPEFNADAKFSGGSGTEGDPYILETAADLAQLTVNAAGAEAAAVDFYIGTYFRLVSDIALNADYANYKTWTTKAPANVWKPIGLNIGANLSVKDGVFKGIVNGGGHVIRGMYVKDETEGWTAAAGFFGLLGGEVYNLGFENCTIVNPKGNAAGIVACIFGSTSLSAAARMEQCYVKDCVVDSFRVPSLLVGSAYSGDIADCWTAGEINVGRTDGEGDGAGLVGMTSGGYVSLKDSYTLATFTGGTSVTGPVIGCGNGTVDIQNTYYDSSISTVEGSWIAEANREYIEVNDVSKKDMNVKAMDLSTKVWKDSDNGPVLKVFDNPIKPGDIVTTEAEEETTTEEETTAAEETTVADETTTEASTTTEADTTEADTTTGAETEGDAEPANLTWLWIAIAAVVVVAAVVAFIIIKKKNK